MIKVCEFEVHGELYIQYGVAYAKLLTCIIQ